MVEQRPGPLKEIVPGTPEYYVKVNTIVALDGLTLQLRELAGTVSQLTDKVERLQFEHENDRQRLAAAEAMVGDLLAKIADAELRFNKRLDAQHAVYKETFVSKTGGAANKQAVPAK